MRRRSGFTLVEVLVSMALILFIMSILAGAFGAASQAVSDLKAAGDLAEKLRAAANVIKHDLGQDHFTEGVQGTTRLSDPKFWDRLDLLKTPPGMPFGFFRIYEAAADTQENKLAPTLDLDNIPSYIQTNAALSYTIAQHGTRRSDFLTAIVPGPDSPSGSSLLLQPSLSGGPYPKLDNFYQDPLPSPSLAPPPGTPSWPFSSQYAEVELFLGPASDTTDDGVTPLFPLYRRQQLAVPRGWTQTSAISAGEATFDVEMSMSKGANGLNFNSMLDLSMPGKRFASTNPAGSGTSYTPLSGSNTAADLLLTDVLSFDVRILTEAVDSMGVVVAGTRDSEFRDIADPQIQKFNLGLNSSYPKSNAPYIFDTWSNLTDVGNAANNYSTWNVAPGSTAIPVFQSSPGGNRIIILAVQITLRVWDFKTKKTRQVTIVQQM